MKLCSLKVAKVLLYGSFTVSQLAGKAGISIASASKGIKELEEKCLVERKGKLIVLASNSLSHELKLLAGNFNIEKLLKERKEIVLIELIEEKSIAKLQKSVGISEVQLSRLLKELMETGAVFKEKDKFALNEKVKKFAMELKKAIDLKQVEPNAVILFSNKFRLKKLPLNAKAKGSLTAFSLFSKFGVEYAVLNDYYVEPEREVSIEEAFIHALAASETKKDLVMCLIFYEKNKKKIEMQKLTKLAIEFKVLLLLFDCIAFLEKRELKKPEKFLPWGEFKVIAENYGLTSKSREKFTAQDLEKLLEEIGNSLKEQLSVFLIGGCNMALQGIKPATKDIDLIVKYKEDFEKLAKALKEIGFKQVVPLLSAYKKMNPNGVFEKNGRPRIDAFTKIVCNALNLSNEMVDKSLERKYGMLSVNFLKPEDIILFKAITEREGDLEDITTIIRTQEVDWNFLLKELDNQHDKSERLFCIDVLDTIEVLEEKEKIKIPIKQKLLDLCLEKSVLFIAKKAITVKEILQKINFSESTVRNKIQKLLKEKKIVKIKGKPFKVVIIGK